MEPQDPDAAAVEPTDDGTAKADSPDADSGDEPDAANRPSWEPL